MPIVINLSGHAFTYMMNRQAVDNDEVMRLYIVQIITWKMLHCIHILHARPWIPGDEKSIFTVVIH